MAVCVKCSCKGGKRAENCDCPKKNDICCETELAIGRVFGAGNARIGSGLTLESVDLILRYEQLAVVLLLVLFALRSCKKNPEAYVIEQANIIFGTLTPDQRALIGSVSKTFENWKVCCWDNCCTLEVSIGEIFAEAISAVTVDTDAEVLQNSLLGVRALFLLLARRLCLNNAAAFVDSWICFIQPPTAPLPPNGP